MAEIGSSEGFKDQRRPYDTRPVRSNRRPDSAIPIVGKVVFHPEPRAPTLDEDSQIRLETAKDLEEEEREAKKEFESALVTLRPFIVSYASKLAWKDQLGEDMANEAIAKALAAWRSFTPGSNFKAWVFAITRNAVYSYTRHERPWKLRHSEITSYLEGVAPRLTDQDATVTLNAVLKAIEGIRFEHREELMLVAQGYEYEEVAAMKGIPVGTVKSRVGRAREKLRAQFGPDILTGTIY